MHSNLIFQLAFLKLFWLYFSMDENIKIIKPLRYGYILHVVQKCWTLLCGLKRSLFQ